MILLQTILDRDTRKIPKILGDKVFDAVEFQQILRRLHLEVWVIICVMCLNDKILSVLSDVAWIHVFWPMNDSWILRSRTYA